MTEPLQPHDPREIGPYRLVGRLGAGGMGQVYLGADGTGRQVAVKVVHPGFAHDVQFRRRFRTEVMVSRQVRGPWVAAVLDADPDAAAPWLATEYVAGPSLAQVLEQTGALTVDAVRKLGFGLAMALAGLHSSGLVHRDIKPSNVLLGAEPKVIDFGISRAIDATRLTGTGFAIGSPGYMSPEQIAGDDAGPASDVFAMGTVLAQAATGRNPFGDVPPMVLMLRISREDPDLTGVPAPLRDLISSCLAKRPADRPDAASVARSLDPSTPADQLPTRTVTRVADVLEPTDPASTTTERDSARRAVGRRAALIGGGVVALGAAAGVTGYVLSRAAQPQARLLWSTEIPALAQYIEVDAYSVYAYTANSVVALDRNTGALLWTTAVGGPSSSAVPRPLAVDRRVVLACSNKALTALDITDGKRRWERPPAKELGGTVMAGGMVVSTTPDRYVIGVDADSGTEKWRIRDRFVHPRLTFADSSTCIVQGRDGLSVEAVDITTGQTRHRYPKITGLITSATSARGTLFAATTDSVIAWDIGSAASRWQAPTVLSELRANDAGSLVGHSASFDDQRLHALDPFSGVSRWTALIPGETRPIYWATAALGSNTIHLAVPGAVHAFDPATGAHLWEYIGPEHTTFGGDSLAARDSVVFAGSMFVESPNEVSIPRYSIKAITGP